MINFRYHIVSITSVFLALAIGLVLGTAVANGPVADNIEGQVGSLRTSNGQLRDQVSELQTRADSQNDFVREVAPMLLGTRLRGRSTVVVSMPGARSEDVAGVVADLETAGDTVTGRVALTDDLTDPNSDNELEDLAASVAVAGVTVPKDGDGVDKTAAMLATVLVTNTVTVSSDDRTLVLNAYKNFLSVQGDVRTPAASVVVVTGPSATGTGAKERDAAVLTVLRRFDRVARFMVVAGPSAAGGTPVRAVRDDDELVKTVSTVDGVSLAEGRVATAMALAEQFAGKTGHYGTGDGATARIPTPTS